MPFKKFTQTKVLILDDPLPYKTHKGSFNIDCIKVENIRYNDGSGIIGGLGEAAQKYLGCTYALLDSTVGYVGRYAENFINVDADNVFGHPTSSGYDQMVASGITEYNLLLNCRYKGTIQDI